MYRHLLLEAKGGTAERPLLLFLHGSGECGTELEKVRTNGPPKLFPRFALDRFSVVAPQCPDENVGWEPAHLAAFLSGVVEQTRADDRRIYVTGLSMGGTGAVDLAAEIPDRVAAAAIRSAGAGKCVTQSGARGVRLDRRFPTARGDPTCQIPLVNRRLDAGRCDLCCLGLATSG